MFEQSSIISIASALFTVGGVAYVTAIVNKTNVENLIKTLDNFKTDIKAEIKTEKAHAMQLAEQRIGAIEKDVNEIFPRLRNAESKSDKNCIVVTQMQKDCLRRHKEGA